MATIKVTVESHGWIPQVGVGPLKNPINIDESLYHSLTRMGYKLTVADETVIIPTITTSTPVVEPVIEEKAVVEEEIITEEVEPVEEAADEEVEEEIIVNDDNYSPDAYYEDEFLTSKTICKKILDAREVQYNSNASLSVLKKAVMESNPEVLIDEEVIEEK